MLFKNQSLSYIESYSKGTLVEHLGIEILEVGNDFLKGRMPVDHRTIQPAGILHGGASVALAETLGSMACHLVLNPDTHYGVGLEINANHIRPLREGWVYGVAKPLHIGLSTQVWQIEMSNSMGKLTCISRLTMAILAIKAKKVN